MQGIMELERFKFKFKFSEFAISEMVNFELRVYFHPG